MSVQYPVPTPTRTDRAPHTPAPFRDQTFILPPAPPPDVELPFLIMQPMTPPQWPRP